MSHDDDEPWFDTHEHFDSWYNTPETMDNYDEWDKSPNICQDIGMNNVSTNEHIQPDFYTCKRQI